jgi:branched-chain amino acid transport system permease protein
MALRYLGILLLVVLALAAPFVLYPVFVMKALCFALFALSLNLLLGYAGLLSFGHAALLGGGAYLTGHAAKVWGLPPELALLTGLAAGAVVGLFFGLLTSRRAGIYFAMITFALAQMIYFLALQLPFTGGEDGLQSVPRGRLLGLLDLADNYVMYYVVLAIFLGGLAFVHRVVTSPFGQVLRAMKDNENRAISLGYKPHHYKIIVFTLAGALAGLAGGMKTLVFGIASLTDVYWHTNGEVVLMTILGGVGTLFGPVVGAFVVVLIQNYFAETGAWVTIIQGVVFVVVVLLFRRGIVGELAPLVRRLLRRKQPAATEASPVPLPEREHA